jgi:anti-repressor protein
MDQLKPFIYGQSQVRTVVIQNEPWFVAKDVCEVLEISKHRDAVSRLDEDERESVIVDTLGGKQDMTAINESGLYSLIMTSRKPEAKQFKRWITHEVIPSIRKHGAYITPETLERTLQDPDYLIGVITALKNEQEARKQLEQKIEEDKHKTIFADAVQASQDCILVGQLATILKQNGVNIGQTRLFNYLREQGYLCKSGDRKNLPTQRAMELKLFEVKEFTVHGNSGIRVRHTPKVTGRGQVYFLNKFLNTAS